jgi:hypothetical protein
MYSFYQLQCLFSSFLVSCGSSDTSSKVLGLLNDLATIKTLKTGNPGDKSVADLVEAASVTDPKLSTVFLLPSRFI